MIDQIDARLVTWIQGVVGASTTVALTPPHDTQADPVVHLYLMQLVPALAAPHLQNAPVQVMLSYLVAVRAADPSQAHKLLSDLVFAALDDSSGDFTLDFDPLPLPTWNALGVEPQPAFVLKVPLSRERPETETPLVRVPMATHTTEVTSLQGVVLGPHDYPLHGVLVELPSLRQYQRTDSHGRFRFAMVPAEASFTMTLRVTGKGHEQEVNIESAAEPLVIHLFEE